MKRDSRNRIWVSVLKFLCKRNPPRITSEELARETGMTLVNASKLLKRMHRYGVIRPVANLSRGPAGGRPMAVYQVTNAGRRRANFEEKRHET